MQRQALISLFRTIVLAAIAAFLVTSAALPTSAQSSVPASAVQAAKMPQYASRLARPASRPASRPTPARPWSRIGPPQDGVLYDNGPINGSSDAWAFNNGFIVSDSYTVTGRDHNGVLAMTFGAWLLPGDTLNSAELSITSSENGGTSYFDQTVSFTQSGCVQNQYGYNVCTLSASFYGPFQDGTFWVNLQNASVTNGDPVYWDENSGAGCESQGCPSLASDNNIGTIPSESFSVLSSCPPGGDEPATPAKVVTAPPSPTQGYRVIYNFTGAGDGGAPLAGLIIDAAGNLYGMTTEGGPLGQGTAFKLSSSASGWRFTRLYSFDSEDGGGFGTLIFDTDGRLIGTTAGDENGGKLFSLSPPGRISPSVFSNWINTPLYDFTPGDEAGFFPTGSLALDNSGNIYGTTQQGGANAGGTLYEFTSAGLQVLHAFPAFSGDGIDPTEVVNGSDGLYGITNNGGSNSVGTLFTTAGGYQVLHNFIQSAEDRPMSLAADQDGNLYGTSTFAPTPCAPFQEAVFSLSPPDWNPLPLVSIEGQYGSWISTDAQGNIYGTRDSSGSSPLGGVFKLTCCWTYTDLHDFSGPPSDGEYPSAGPVVDAQGNIYGTTTSGGTHGFGTVWEISP
jgi:uncharacterized repeat protein (TIGR03803 family)